MGFLDKAKAQMTQPAEKAQEGVKGAQEKLDTAQAKRRADALLRDLGAWHYASHSGRGGDTAGDEIARITAELEALEAEHGPLGAARSEAAEQEGEPAAPTPSPTDAPVVPTDASAPPAPPA